ncbi:MAG TPA: UDP-glucose 4-epimerase GalE [Candidatus Onthenecus intestinigallinarum]|uniref:UDP-glucose 4-epimerase n=1 Tax=Candidatus Onthenecus intestinigallinarum TaxID=2840875 RepID=A0A9D1CPW8_9FIRM|nr:UDP-glucose 4-epimerase GalE [Candidatus Onthenecus intestinigallinarum]
MNILLTGGAGFIGTHTCVELLSSGHDVVIADNFYNSSPEAVRRVEEITGRSVKLYDIDVCDPAKVDALFAENQIDAVIHFAAYKAVGESVSKPLEYYRNNLDCTLTVCEAMRRHGVKRFIFSSSATVYGIPDHMPLDETMPTSCTNPYGWTKYMNERILTDIAKANPEWSVVLLRYFNPIGAHESGRIGEMPNGIPNNLLPYITQVAAGKLDHLSVFGNDYPTHDGTGVRDYIHVVDLAKGHVAAAAYAQTHTGVEVINLGTGTGYSVLDIVHAFERVNGVKVPYQIVPRRPGDIAECWADPKKAKELLGWQAEKNLEDMCRDSWRWQSQNPNGYAD